MDVYPVSNVHAYSDFSQTTFEVSHGHYSTNCFWNAGVIYDVLKSLSLSVSAVNLLDRRVYEEAFTLESITNITAHRCAGVR